MTGSRTESAEARFRQAGIPFTVQRRAIWAAFCRRRDHPTAENVFQAVAPQLPGLSRTTVYRTLEAFVELGLAQRLGHPGAAVRFDPKITRHHHLICELCGAVTDLEDRRLDRLRLPRLADSAFRVRDFSVQIAGICGTCAAQDID